MGAGEKSVRAKAKQPRRMLACVDWYSTSTIQAMEPRASVTFLPQLWWTCLSCHLHPLPSPSTPEPHGIFR